MAPTKTAAPPKKKVPAKGKQSAAAPAANRMRLAIYLGTIVAAILLVWLIVGVSSSSPAAPKNTTTTSNPIEKLLSFRKQISVSMADTQSAFGTFKTTALACNGKAVCIETAANTALDATGSAANLVHQTDFKTQLLRNDASGYVRVLIELQRAYQGISFSSTSQVQKDISDLNVFLRQAQADATKTLQDL